MHDKEQSVDAVDGSNMFSLRILVHMKVHFVGKAHIS
jgi:hypothetical protein